MLTFSSLANQGDLQVCVMTRCDEELGEEDKLIEDVHEPIDGNGYNGPAALRIFRYKALVALLVAMIILAIASSGHHPLLQIQDLTSIARKYENLDTWLFNGETVKGAAATSAGFSSAPAENMHDGNLCGDDEELFEDLCYMKCTLLTEGKNPIRTSAFTCCESHPCGFGNTIFNMNAPCAGFDVAGKINGQKGACPHTLGTCLEDEELLLGMCYKKCSLLTGGQFTHRVAATTCCSQTGLACLNPMNLRTDFVDFPVGGGKGDGTKSTPSKPHKPLKVLTEKNTTGPTSVSSATTPSSPQTAQAAQATSAPL